MLPGLGLGRWPMPCALTRTGCCPDADRRDAGPCPVRCENGLLPGRGAPPGRGALRALRRAGLRRGRCRGAAGAAGAAAAAGAAGAAGAGAAGAAAAVLQRPRRAAAGAGVGAGAAAAGRAERAPRGAGAPGRAGRHGSAAARAGAGAAAAAARLCSLAAPSASRAARSLRATGGSMVDEGLLTNSPSSFSFARATLLSTPSSDAISCTRGLAATILLSGWSTQAGQTVSCGRVSFRAVHFVSIAVQPFLEGLRVKRA